LIPYRTTDDHVGLFEEEVEESVRQTAALMSASRLLSQDVTYVTRRALTNRRVGLDDDNLLQFDRRTIRCRLRDSLAHADYGLADSDPPQH